MPLAILQVGEPVLRQRGRPLSVEEVRSRSIQQLIELMRETMRQAPGVGLAAPQVGYALQLAVVEDRAEYLEGMSPAMLAERERQPVPFHVIINPRLSMADETPAAFFEGCLSVEGFAAIVPRALAVRVDCLNEHGELLVIGARGWHARILQHEIDHLNGTLYIDRMATRSFMTADNLTRYWRDKTVAEVRAELDLAYSLTAVP
jgi:peptide deformylase